MTITPMMASSTIIRPTIVTITIGRQMLGRPLFAALGCLQPDGLGALAASAVWACGTVLALSGRVVRSRAPRKAEAYLLPVRKSDVGGTWLVDDTCLSFLLDVREAAGRPEARRLVARRLVARRTLARRPAAWRPAGECPCGIWGFRSPASA